VPEEQSPTWRELREAGMARELTTRPLTAKRVVNEVLILAVEVILLRSMLIVERVIKLFAD
jgi:hypothetical protein